GARETVGSTVVQKSGIQCYNCKEYGHVARECQKPKRAKDTAYHMEKMLLCKQEEAGIHNNMQTQTSNTLHNAIMEAGSKDRPSMLTPGNYVQWKFRIKRYIDTKPNHELIHYCLTNPPYELGWKEKFVLDSKGNPTTTTEKVFETYKNVTQEIRDQLNAKAEAV
nr:retrovirus-related Pol polyprotein from transposon TNT 1-94 [Tanacetum cinerariifolium]